MKYSRFLYLICLLATHPAIAQNSAEAVFHLNKIPAEGLILDKGWTYKAGDNPERAALDYHDDDWVSLDPTDELHHLADVSKSNIGWFRLKFEVDSSLFGKTFALVVSNLGASETYFNGQLLYRFGIVSGEYEKEQTRFVANKVLSLKLANHSTQLIAIRYSFNKKNLYLKLSNAHPVISLKLKPINQAFSDHAERDNFESTLRSIQLSFYLPLGFLLLFLFYSFRLRKEYLYSGIFCFCMFLAIFIHILTLSAPTSVSRMNYFLLVPQVLYIIGALAFIDGVYIIYNRKRSWFYYIMALYGIWSILYFFISYDWSGIFNAFFFPLINLEFLRLNLQAVYNRKKGAWILLVTSLLLTASLVWMVSFNIAGNPEGALLQSISYILPGIGLSLFYAGEFARTASALRLRAIEVAQLSREMIAKEREKQQILGAQNETLEKQVSERTSALSASLKELKETQHQLIHREKMASLGELTAGIAHEIQNPLNFVNNFSEVNKELIEELKQEATAGNQSQVIAIADNINDNQEKINHHGKRADAIVKGMLQHSKASTGQKELTDINKLADEYLRLSYHGFRAKDKSFNANTSTDFDESIEKINIVPQDIGRVLLNLYNNAFYALHEKQKACQAELVEAGYDPTVSVSTKKAGDKILISVKDNGSGIPQNIVDKIFQPFFTTKPTGQGTGLGLSLSYDIIKAHGGEIKVENREGLLAGEAGSEFIIRLPLNLMQ